MQCLGPYLLIPFQNRLRQKRRVLGARGGLQRLTVDRAKACNTLKALREMKHHNFPIC